LFVHWPIVHLFGWSWLACSVGRGSVVRLLVHWPIVHLFGWSWLACSLVSLVP
jgi:hypothetical protein